MSLPAHYNESRGSGFGDRVRAFDSQFETDRVDREAEAPETEDGRHHPPFLSL